MPIDEIAMLRRMAEHVAHTPVVLTSETISNEAIDVLVQTMANRGGINDISVHGCTISHDAVANLVAGIHMNGLTSPIHTLELSGLDIKYDTLQHVAGLIRSEHCCVMALRLGFNGIGEGSAALLAQAVVSREVDGCANTRNVDSFTNRSFALNKSSYFATGLRLLDLQNNRLHSLGLISLAPILRAGRSTLVALNISDNHISGADGCEALAHFLRENRCLENLIMDRNEIGDAGLAFICDAVIGGNNNVLQRLCLSGTQITPVGAASLRRLMEHPGNAITELLLNKNPLGVEGCKELADGLCSPNNRVTALKLSGVDAMQAGAEEIARGIRSPNCRLENLHLKNNLIYSEGLIAIANALRANKENKLGRLLLRLNTISNMGIVSLFRAIKEGAAPKLEELDLRDAEIHEEGGGLPAVIEGLSSPNCNLKLLDLTDSLNTVDRSYARWTEPLATAVLGSQLRVLVGFPGSVERVVKRRTEQNVAITGGTATVQAEAIDWPVPAYWEPVKSQLMARQRKYNHNMPTTFSDAAKLLMLTGDKLSYLTAQRSHLRRMAQDDRPGAGFLVGTAKNSEAAAPTEQILAALHEDLEKALAITAPAA